MKIPKLPNCKKEYYQIFFAFEKDGEFVWVIKPEQNSTTFSSEINFTEEIVELLLQTNSVIVYSSYNPNFISTVENETLQLCENYGWNFYKTNGKKIVKY